jgi:8-oxo-dGTP pyrophosphatase MutT (NUDIX family)
MNDIETSINDILDDKKKYCINCGKNGHINKDCKEPITSSGIILFKYNQKKINSFLKKNINIDYFINKFNRVDNKRIILNETKNILDIIDSNVLEFLKNNISFLLVQRKATLGFIEFVRGRYNIEDNSIVHLFNQMTKEEIIAIERNTNNFDYLWNRIWGINRDLYYDQEFDSSKKKFDQLQKNDIFHILLKIEPKYKTPEWGFPKGRRNYKENNINCAKREVLEETNLVEGDYQILNGVYPLVEIMTGTNDKVYKHIYFLGICNTNNEVYLDKYNELQMSEIGDIGWYNYNESMLLLRDYHKEKKKIISIIFSFISGQILKYNYMPNTKQYIKKIMNNQLNI